MISTSRKPRVVRRPTLRLALDDDRWAERGAVDGLGQLRPRHAGLGPSARRGRPRQAADGSGYVVSRLAVSQLTRGGLQDEVGERASDVEAHSIRHARSAPAIGPGERDPIGIPPAGLVGQARIPPAHRWPRSRSVRRAAAECERGLEHLGHGARRQRGVDGLLEELDRRVEQALDRPDERASWTDLPRRAPCRSSAAATR